MALLPWHRFETRQQPLLNREGFLKRLLSSAGIALSLIAVSLLVGMLGYHLLEEMPWIDAFASAAMILSGMGPLGPMNNWWGKFFAGCYALYSGLALIFATGILFAPVLHRIMHRFHLEDDDEK